MKTAHATGRNISVSTKAAIEVCKFLRGKMVDDAIDILEHVLIKSQAIPFTRFTNGLGHKPGMAAGRYPVKVAHEILALLENVKVNASNQGMSGSLKITTITADRASRPTRNRAKYRGEFKRSHIELEVTEVAPKKTAKKADKPKAEKPAETPKTADVKLAKKEEASTEKKEAPKPTETKKAPAATKNVEKPKENDHGN